MKLKMVAKNVVRGCGGCDEQLLPTKYIKNDVSFKLLVLLSILSTIPKLNISKKKLFNFQNKNRHVAYIYNTF